MDEATSGLDALPGAKVQSAPVKGGISVPGVNMLDSNATEQLLANMQELINQRSHPDAFQNAAEDIRAIGAGKGQERQAYKDQQAQELFNMRAQMAAVRGSQATQQRLAQEVGARRQQRHSHSKAHSHNKAHNHSHNKAITYRKI